MSSAKWLALPLALLLSACQDVTDDLDPSGTDRRAEVVAGTSGHAAGQLAPDFTVPDSRGVSFTLSAELGGTSGVAMYFAMWCPVCDSHMSHMRTRVAADFPQVKFIIVDYVSGSASGARAAQIANGYTDFRVLADGDQAVLNLYDATMGSTVVVDSNGVVRMNEDYKDGTRLRETLEALP
ncbi:MAG: peroxiredoxin family protein [Gammaproteobacteria bacterium]